MNTGGCKTGCRIRRQNHVYGFRNSGWIEHRNERMNVLELTGHDIEACRCIHPAVHKCHKYGREDTADRDDDAGEKMKPSRYPVPTIEVDTKKDCLSKEGETFQRKRHSYDGTGILHKLWPQEAEFERQNSAGDSADGEEDGCPLRPALCQ